MRTEISKKIDPFLMQFDLTGLKENEAIMRAYRVFHKSRFQELDISELEGNA